MDGNMVGGITLRVSYARRQTNSLTPTPTNRSSTVASSNVRYERKQQSPPSPPPMKPQPIAQHAWSDASEIEYGLFF